MGRIGKFLEFIRSTIGDDKVPECIVDLAGGNNVTAPMFQPIGEDSQPLSTDKPVLVKLTESGAYAVVGFVDVVNEGTAEPGAKRSYARDPETGDIVIESLLNNDGSGEMKNELGSFKLQSNGNVVINGVTIDTSGNITTPGKVTADTDVVAAGVSGKDHVHLPGTLKDGEGSSVTGLTGAPSP